MVSISLRAYVNEINDMVDQHQIIEAIAHCRHILKKHPKQVDTYRLLGKAYLEEQRYGDAADILQRVLSSVPEDFISQVGMSIIREDEGNLDSAIYHMERAFETQPSNHAIQSELRRLNTKRDGVELTRVRLTRGALARMYAHGHLYDQAISELLAALAEDPNRFDLQNLLAEMYYKTDKKVDAAETCTRILDKLPYCINANQLITQILEENGRPEEAQRYRQRWAALDPYAKFVGKEFSLIDMVPDNKVVLNQLEYDPSGLYEESEQPAWASSLGLAVDGEDSDESLPDWLGGAGKPSNAFDSAQPTAMLSESDADPLFTDDPGIVDGNRIGLMPQADGGDADQGDDWISRLDQPEDETPAKSEEPSAFSFDPGQQEDTGDWISSMDATEEEPSSTDAGQFTGEFGDDDTDDWLSSLDTPSEEPAPVAESPFPVEGEAEDTGDWLSSMDATEEEPSSTDAGQFTGEFGDDDTDDWLSSLDTPSDRPSPATESPFPVESEAEDTGDWQASLDASPEETTPSAADDFFPPEGDEEAAEDWLASLDAPSEEPAPAAESLLPDKGEVEDTGDWLASLDAPSEETAPSAVEDFFPPEGDEEATGDWLASLDAPDEEPTSAVESPLPEEGEAEDTDDWLASLDKKATETLPTPDTIPAADPGNELPDFLKDAGWESGSGEVDESAPVELGGVEQLVEANIPEWIQEMSPDDDPPAEDPDIEANPEWMKSMEAPASGPADWIAEVENAEEEPVAETTDQEAPQEEIAPGQTIEPDEMDMAWLENLAAKQGIPDEEMTTSAEKRAEVTEEDTPELDSSSADLALPDTLQEQPVSEEPAEGKPDGDTDWLTKIGLSQPEEQEGSPEDQVGDSTAAWLEAVQDEQDTAPASGDAQDTVTGFLASKPLSEETIQLDYPGEESEEDWLAQAIQEQDQPSISSDKDNMNTDWLKAIGQEAAEEAAADEQLGQEQPPQGEELPTSPVDEDEDDFDMDWLSQIGDEAAQEAAGPEADEPAETPFDGTDEAWLADLGAVEEETPTDVQPVQEKPPHVEAVPASPVDEEEDDFDMDWLSQIGDEAAQEAAGQEAVKPAAEIETPFEGTDEAWLADLGAGEEETPADVQAAQEQPPQVEELPTSPVDEDEDDFDMDWLDEISEDAAQEAAEGVEEVTTPIEEAPVAKPPAPPVNEDDLDMGWLDEVGSEEAEKEAPVSIEAEDESSSGFDNDAWLANLDTLQESQSGATDWLASQKAKEEAASEAAEPVIEGSADILDEAPAPIGEAPVEETPVSPVDEEEDDFDMDWLDSIGEEAAQEAAESVVEEVPTPIQDEAPVEESPTEEQIPVEEPTADDWLTQIEAEDDLQHGESISDTDAWLLSMETEAIPSQEEEAEEPVADSDEELSPDAAPIVESESPSETPESSSEAIQSTQAEEWRPEGEVPPQMTAPEPQPDPLADQLSVARQAMQDNDLENGLKGFAAIIKKGKFIEEVIEALNLALTRHPINAQIWQALGDAYLRVDNLQEALDAYSKAEDLLR